jgi:acyl dehydratase
VDADVGRRYAQVSGDYNPIHLHPLSARLFGFKRPIAHGWWLLARSLAELDDEVGDACRVEARFADIVPLGSDVLFTSGRCADGSRRFRLDGRRGVLVEGMVSEAT